MPSLLPAVRTEHDHPGNELAFKAAQSTVDRNMYVFQGWVTDVLKNTPGLKRSQKLLLRGFFKFVQKNLHRAVCAETWHYLGELTDKIITIVKTDDMALDELSQKLAEPETKAKLQEALGLSDMESQEITAEEIAKAFRKMFKIPQAGQILIEFRSQVGFVEESLVRLGFP